MQPNNLEHQPYDQAGNRFGELICSCGKPVPKEQQDKNMAELQQYLRNNNISVTTTTLRDTSELVRPEPNKPDGIYKGWVPLKDIAPELTKGDIIFLVCAVLLLVFLIGFTTSFLI
jgi:hypothetical protein